MQLLLPQEKPQPILFLSIPNGSSKALMKRPLFNYIVATGGIGAGRFFELEGHHTLGRNESRLAKFTEHMDFCKLHIILHYVAVFINGDIPVYAIGRIGADEEGRILKAEMEKAGINVLYVTEDTGNPTMYSICGQYPNGEGFNITANNSACQTVSTDDVNCFFNDLKLSGPGIVIAAPEVPLETRLHLLRKGREKQCFNTAAVPTGEAKAFIEQGGAALTDLLALNLDEAYAFASLNRGNAVTEEEILDSCVNYLQTLNPELTIVITLGSKGAFARYRDSSYRSEALDVPVINTAGAGDCFLGTLAAAKARGIEIFPLNINNDKLQCAIDLGIAASGKKVRCKDTIDFSMSIQSLEDFSGEHGIFFSDEIKEAFFNDP
jgi:sugar/nucleoside kinase (ribokinase family)